MTTIPNLSLRSEQHQQLNSDLLSFLNASPTPFHATLNIAAVLLDAGYQQLDEADAWDLAANGKYFVTRNDSSIIAWRHGGKPFAESGIGIVGAHTDSPCLSVRPNPELDTHGVLRLGVEVYGGVLLNPWFDRDLSLAGRVHYSSSGELKSALVDFHCPIATLPSLAIHLDRDANSKRSINAQNHTPVLLATNKLKTNSKETSKKQSAESVLHGLLKDQLKSLEIEAESIQDYQLAFYDTQAAAVIGIDGDFIASARLDNLLSCYVDTQALVASDESNEWAMLVCNDHEEVGSQSHAGAAGPFLKQVLERIEPDGEALQRGISQSMLISTDNAHALHPNHVDKMEPKHSPMLNAGPVIKVNANQRYASNSETQAVFRSLCEKMDVPVQTFVTRGDMGCGSTIGPITAAEIGVKTLDVGLPTLGMHSIRELGGYEDTAHLFNVLTAFLARV